MRTSNIYLVIGISFTGYRYCLKLTDHQYALRLSKQLKYSQVYIFDENDIETSKVVD